MAILQERARFFGYGLPGQTPPRPAPDGATLMALLPRESRIVSSITLIPGGYPKFDEGIARAEAFQDEAIITYAPTPNDRSGNKTEWLKYMSINRHGADIVAALCRAFPHYRIVFKPYADEFPEVMETVCRTGEAFTNFSLDRVGSEHADLYARTRFLVSDFSSTAFTFALSTLRPVVFFSANEARLQEYIRRSGEDEYCSLRPAVGAVVESVDAMIAALKHFETNPNCLRASITRLRNEISINAGHASEAVADALTAWISGETRPEWRLYQSVR